MVNLQEIEEREQLIKESERLKEMTNLVIDTHKKKFKKEIIKEQCKMIRDEFEEYIRDNDIDFYERQAVQQFVMYQIKKLMEDSKGNEKR